jgi:hypothetical protein
MFTLPDTVFIANRLLHKAIVLGKGDPRIA